jgi:2'-5' RNA ligase
VEKEVSGLKRISYDYSCLMARMPDPIAAKVRSIAEAIPPEFIYNTLDGERGKAKDVHVTVLYGIHTTNIDEVLPLVAGMAPLRATLGRTSAFYNPECIALKVNMQSRDLVNLNNLIRRSLQYTSIYPNYIPHVTIAYLKKDDKNPYYYRDYMTDDFEGTEVVLDELVFSTPNGKKETIHLDGRVASVVRELRIASSVLSGRMVRHAVG